MATGLIIVLNGTSSAGKTSIAQALRAITVLPLLHLAVDDYIHMIPQQYWAANPQATVQQTFQNLISGYHRCVVALAQTGNSVIADHVLQEPAWWAECATLFAPLPAYLITVYCPLDELERRERARGDREIGLARSQYAQIYETSVGDFTVDTSLDDAYTCARKIDTYITAKKEPRAFRDLQQRSTLPAHD